MIENHDGKKLKRYIKLNGINVDRDLLPKLDMSKATFYKQYDLDKIKPEYVNAFLKAGIDFLGQSPVTRLKSNLEFQQRESGLTERVRQLESQMAQLQTSILDLYSRLPKQT